ncbi:MAG TPA: NAD-binding protein, partial [Novosphingobium sp.]|nr:NAD-binding protein [Novosphingobium sp.]
QGGEFGFVLFAQAQNAFLIDAEAASLFGAVVTLSMATTPFLMRFTRDLRAEAESGPVGEREGPSQDGANALVVGYGRFGQTVAQLLMASDVAVTLIDSDVAMIDVAGSFGSKVYFGDGTRLDVLRQAGAAEAEMILFCLDGDQLTADFLEAVHEAFPAAALYVRAYDRRAMIALGQAPVRKLVREVLESAVIMARRALSDSGLALEQIDRAEAMYRARDRERLRLQVESGDIRVARDRIITEPVGGGQGQD